MEKKCLTKSQVTAPDKITTGIKVNRKLWNRFFDVAKVANPHDVPKETAAILLEAALTRYLEIHRQQGLQR